MPFNGSGVYSPPSADFPAVSGTVILAAKFNSVVNDMSTGISTCITKDGQTTPTANLPMGGFKHTTVANSAARDQYAATGQVQDQSFTWCGTAGGTADALTLSPTPPITAYAAGQSFVFKSGASPNTGAATVAVSGLATKAIQVDGAALTAATIEADTWYRVTYDGAAFQLEKVTRINLGAILDSIFRIVDQGDLTKKIAFELSGITTATTRTLTPQDRSGTIALIDEFAYAGLAGASGRLVLPINYISGFELANNGGTPATNIDIAAGVARDSANVANLIGAAMTKTQNSWTAGNGNGGRLHAAAVVANTMYHWFAIHKDSDGTVDYGFDASLTPTIPAGYTRFRYLMSVPTQPGSTDWVLFLHHGHELLYKLILADYDATLGATQTVTVDLNATNKRVPASFKVKAMLQVATDAGNDNKVMTRVLSPDFTDVTPGTSLDAIASMGWVVASGTVARVAGRFDQWTDSSGQIRLINGTNANNNKVRVLGYYNRKRELPAAA